MASDWIKGEVARLAQRAEDAGELPAAMVLAALSGALEAGMEKRLCDKVAEFARDAIGAIDSRAN